MKILYLITKSNWGGAQKYVFELATSSYFFNAQVAVAFGGRGELFDRLKEHREIELYTIAALQRNINPFKELIALRDMYLLIKRYKPDILHLNSSKAAGLGGVMGRMCGVKKIVLTVHGAPFREDRNVFSRGLIKFFTWFSCLLAHSIITVSKVDEFDLAKMPLLKKKICTIYNGLVYEELPEKIKRSSKEVQIVSIGELNQNKGHVYAISAMQLLVKKGYHIHYTIIGEGRTQSLLERAIHMKDMKNHVTILGGHTSDAASLLHQYDIFIMPSLKEGLPYVLLEAGRAMVPVIATITGGIPEIIIHEKTGLLVKPKDIEGLAQEIEKLIVSRELSKKLSQDLREHVVSTFSRSRMLAETARVYGFM